MNRTHDLRRWMLANAFGAVGNSASSTAKVTVWTSPPARPEPARYARRPADRRERIFYSPFAMNTEAEIVQANQDFQAGAFGHPG